MAFELRQQIKLTQQLVMTPQLQQAIKLLQLSRMELQNAVQQELNENPVLEEVADDESEPGPEGQQAESEGEAAAPEAAETEASTAQDELVTDVAAEAGSEPEPTAEEMVSDVDWESYIESRPQTSLAQGSDDRPPLEDSLTPSTSLAAHLQWQLGLSNLDEIERELGLLIIGNLDDSGYLVESLDEIAGFAGVELELAEQVCERIQEFDPVGVAARDLAECLRIQIRRAGITDLLVIHLIDEHLDLLQRRDFRAIARLENCTVKDVSVAADVVASLEPRPGREFSSDEPIYITPDIYVHKIADEYHVVLNEDGLPKLRVSQAYRAVLGRAKQEAKETRDYVREKLRSAVWLIKSIHQRQRTICKVMESIIRFQREFFDKGTEFMRPLNLRDIAEDIEMHESTVSRVTTNKYVQTPHGIFELKFFFNSSIQTGDGASIASESVKEKIRSLIKAEDGQRPLSDQRIAEILKQTEDIKIARRTVTKYRESMRILSSTRRRQFR